jgi:hypothetical protein
MLHTCLCLFQDRYWITNFICCGLCVKVTGDCSLCVKVTGDCSLCVKVTGDCSLCVKVTGDCSLCVKVELFTIDHCLNFLFIIYFFQI